MHISYITQEKNYGQILTHVSEEHNLSIYQSIEEFSEASKYIRTDILLVNIEECINKEFLFKETCKALPSTIIVFTSNISNPAAGFFTTTQYEFIEEPIKPKIINQILNNYKIAKKRKSIYIKTMPNFCIYQNGQEIAISGNKTIELLAFLADSNGNLVHKNQILKAIWNKNTSQSVLRNTTSKLNMELKKYGIHDLVKRQGEYRYIDKTMFNSDLNNILEKLQGIENYNNKYLEEYPAWNKYTKNILENISKNFKK